MLKIDFDEIFENHQVRVVNTCYRFVGNREDAEDVAQDVFMEIYKSYDSFRGECALSTWIYRIAVNRSMDFLRKEKREKRGGFLKRIFLGDDNDHLLASPDFQNPEREMLAAEKMGIIKNALQKLPENQRIVFTLSKVEGFSQKEIADVLETSESAVESLNVRARKNLKKHLAAFFNKMPKKAQEKK